MTIRGGRGYLIGSSIPKSLCQSLTNLQVVSIMREASQTFWLHSKAHAVV